MSLGLGIVGLLEFRGGLVDDVGSYGNNSIISCYALDENKKGTHDIFTYDNLLHNTTIDDEREIVFGLVNFVESVVENCVTASVINLMDDSDEDSKSFLGINQHRDDNTENETKNINKESTPTVYGSIKEKLETEINKWCGGTIDKLRKEYVR
jgi:hypothetical protein